MKNWYHVKIEDNHSTYMKAESSEDAIDKVIAQHYKNHYKRLSHKSVTAQLSDKVSYEEIVNSFPRARYIIDVDWDYLETSLERYKEHYNLELEPDFQRNHVWTEAQQIAYVEYAMRGGMSGREVYFNAANWQGNDETGDMVLVDGLQRLTAIRKFMRGDLKVFGGYVRNDFQYLSSSVCTIKFAINDLKTRKEVLQWYIDFNSGGTLHTSQELEKVKKLIEAE